MIRIGTFIRPLAAIAIVCVGHTALAQDRPPPPANAQAGAPVDLTGQWVSIISEDWRWRMVTPPKGDYMSVPLTEQGRQTADSWDLAADNAAQLQCKAYGAGGLLRVPGRIRISWENADTLRLESDAGQQVRRYNFIAPGTGNVLPALSTPASDAGDRTWQGHTKAQWFKQPQSRGLGFGGAQGDGGALYAITQNLRAGYLRKNGVPYSENAIITEQFNVFDHEGETWLVITSIVDDPENLSQPFITSTNFRKESGAAGWSPSECFTDPPHEMASAE